MPVRSVKAASVAVPVFSKYWIFQPSVPVIRSRSPSPSRSPNVVSERAFGVTREADTLRSRSVRGFAPAMFATFMSLRAMAVSPFM